MTKINEEVLNHNYEIIKECYSIPEKTQDFKGMVFQRFVLAKSELNVYFVSTATVELYGNIWKCKKDHANQKYDDTLYSTMVFKELKYAEEEYNFQAGIYALPFPEQLKNDDFLEKYIDWEMLDDDVYQLAETFTQLDDGDEIKNVVHDQYKAAIEGVSDFNLNLKTYLKLRIEEESENIEF